MSKVHEKINEEEMDKSVPPRNPYWNPEITKFYSFDLTHHPHNSGQDYNQLTVEANTAENAINVMAKTGHCCCPSCWNTIVGFVSMNKPVMHTGEDRFIGVEQATAILISKPVGIN